MILWGDAAESVLHSLYVIQKRAIRCVDGADYFAHKNPIFRKLGVLKLADVYMYALCIEMFLNKNSDKYRLNHSVQTRNRHLTHPAYQRLAMSQRAFSYAGPTAWNSLPYDLRIISSMSSFKRKLKLYLLKRYE